MRISRAFFGAIALAIVAFPAAAEEGAVIRADELKAMPFIDAATAAKVPANQPVTIVSRKGGWIEVRANGQTGWLRMLNVRLAAGSSPAQGQAQVRSASLPASVTMMRACERSLVNSTPVRVTRPTRAIPR